MTAYQVTPARAWDDAIANLLLPDADYTVDRLTDAVWALAEFRTPTHPGFQGHDPDRTVLTRSGRWTYAQARAIVDHAFGPDGHERVSEAVTTYRDRDVRDMSSLFYFRIALLLRAGWTREVGWDWRYSLGGTLLPVSLSAMWVAIWSVDSLTACARAGMGVEALQEVLSAGVLPPPESVAMLAGLRFDPITGRRVAG